MCTYHFSFIYLLSDLSPLKESGKYKKNTVGEIAGRAARAPNYIAPLWLCEMGRVWLHAYRRVQRMWVKPFWKGKDWV